MTADRRDGAAGRGARAGALAGYAAYDVLGALAGLLALPLLPVLAATRHGTGLAERLGRLPGAVATLGRPLWVHAASVGEALAAEPLLHALRARHPGLPVLLSTTTATGRAVAARRLPVDAAMLLPADVLGIVDRAIRRVRPVALVLVETELWPGLIRAAARCGVPRLVVSGRLSERAARRYRRVRWFMRAVLAEVDGFAMQTEADAARIRALGAPPDRVVVLGNLKLARAAGSGAAAGVPAPPVVVGDRPVLVAASTHPGEEELVLAACAPLWTAHPAVLLVLAPRRPERTAEVARLLDAAGVPYVRRSLLGDSVPADARVLLLDTLGELAAFFPGARAAFVGGTVAPVGGHNVVEPAACGVPVAFGPHTATVAPWADALLAAGGAHRIGSAAELTALWSGYLDDAAGAAAAGARARAVVAAQAGVAERTAAFVSRWLAPATAAG